MTGDHAGRRAEEMIVKRALREGPFAMRQLAEDAGLSYGGVRGWAVGHRIPTAENLRRLAKAFRARASKLTRLADELDEAARFGGDGS